MSKEVKAGLIAAAAMLGLILLVVLTIATKGLFLIFVGLIAFGVAIYFAVLDELE